MTTSKPKLRWTFYLAVIFLGVAGMTASLYYKKAMNVTVTEVHADDSTQELEVPASFPVKMVHPKKGVLERLSTQPGTIETYESVRLFSEVPGFLKKQMVDIGDPVKKGQVLAVVAVPELDTQVVRDTAAIELARSKVLQMKARLESAKAELDAVKAAVYQAEASARSASAWVRYRASDLDRIDKLVASNSLERRLLDIAKDHYEASVESEISAKAAIATTKAKVVAAGAKIDQGKADVSAAESEVKVAQADLERVHVMLEYATIKAPFDGVVTYRGYNPGAFIRAANQNGANDPLFTVHRTDLMRVVVMIPDRDVPFTDPGDLAEVEIDSLPGKKFPAKVSRIGKSLDAQTRLMRVELDLKNPTGEIFHGMYGHVNIVLDRQKDLLSIPAGCLVGKTEDDIGTVYVVHDGRAHQVSVQLGGNNGLRAAILDGLTVKDDVIFQPGSALADGVEVVPTLWDEKSPPKSNPLRK